MSSINCMQWRDNVKLPVKAFSFLFNVDFTGPFIPNFDTLHSVESFDSFFLNPNI